jgi:hypothetical protein
VILQVGGRLVGSLGSEPPSQRWAPFGALNVGISF